MDDPTDTAIATPILSIDSTERDLPEVVHQPSPSEKTHVKTKY